MDDLQIRAIPGSSAELLGQVTDVDSRSHRVQVRFPHEAVDTYKTTFGPDCFRESFATRLPAMCWQHDLRDPIGRVVQADVLPKWNELIGQFSDIDAVPSARRAFTQLDDGTLTDFSHGFTGGREVPHPDPELRKRGVRQIPKATMKEISPVTIGSIPGAVATDIRQEGGSLTMSVTEILEAVRMGLMTREAGALAIREQHPEYREYINLDAIRAMPPARPMADGSPWDGMAGMLPHQMAGGAGHDAEPAGSPDEHAVMAEQSAELCRVAAASGNGQVAQGHAARAMQYALSATNANTGTPQSIAAIQRAMMAATAASAAVAAMTSPGRSASDETVVTAEAVLAAARRADPALGAALDAGEWSLAIAPTNYEFMFRSADGIITGPDGEPVDGEDAVSPEALELAQLAAEALESSRQWLEDVDTSTLPTAVQEALTLVGAARSAQEALLEAMGTRDDGDGDEDDDWGGYSDTPWENFSQADYSPEQWKSAALIDTGEGAEDSKGRYKLPVKEPNGKVNRHGLAAAAGRLDQTEGLTPAQKKAAAGKIASLYKQAKKDLPPKVAAVLSASRAEEEDVERRYAETILKRRAAHAGVRTPA